MERTPTTGNAPKEYTRGEELANGLTHGIGAALSIAGLSVLVTFAGLAGDAWKVVAFSVYGASMVLLYLSSTFYHSFRSPRLKRLFRLLDHCVIFLLIAGSYTPFTLVTLRGPWGWTLFGLIWAFALFGIIITVLALDRIKWLAIGIYVGMGWLAVVAIKPLLEALPLAGFLWLAAGGLFYTLGIVFYVWHRLPYNHAIWHLFVLGGTVCQFLSILWYVLPA